MLTSSVSETSSVCRQKTGSQNHFAFGYHVSHTFKSNTTDREKTELIGLNYRTKGQKNSKWSQTYKKKGIWIQQCWGWGPNTKASCFNNATLNPVLLQTSKKDTRLDRWRTVCKPDRSICRGTWKRYFLIGWYRGSSIFCW